ncbi:hypothetical protein BGW38_006953, partial [Lunasporangiospora selenospora]
MAAKDLSRKSLDKKLGMDGSVDQWNSYIDANFQSLWEAEEEARAKISPKGRGRADSNYSTDTAGGGESSKKRGRDEDDDESDSDGKSEMEEETEPDLKEYRTCTATLQQILRQDLCAEDKERIRILLEEGQETMTVVCEEISVLARKAVHEIASGTHYIEDGITPPSRMDFDLRAVFPTGFKFRDTTIQSLIPVGAIPDLLPEHLEAKKKSDTATLLSHQFLNYIYSRFFGVQGVNAATEAKHRVWKSVVDKFALDAERCPVDVTGRVSTVNEHLTQLATNIENLWNGPTYDKLLDHTLLLLLRLHLAPEREQKQRERKANRQATRQESSPKNAEMSKRRWKRTILELCNDLDRALDKDPIGDGQRVQSILNRIVSTQALRHSAQAAGAGHFKPLDIRLDHLRTAVVSNLGIAAGDTILEAAVEADDEASVEALRRTVEKLDTDGLDISSWNFSELEDDPAEEPKARASSKVSNQVIKDPIKDLETVILEGIDFSDWDETEIEEEPAKESTIESNDEVSAEALWRAVEEELDDRDDGELAEEIEKEVGENLTNEPTRAAMMSLRSLLHMLLESPHITKEIDSNWVKKSARSGVEITEEQCRVVAKLANALRPYVAKRRIGKEGTSQGGTRAPLAHATLLAPMSIIANAILRAAGYAQSTRLLSPQISPSSTHALLLGAKGIYEVLCAKTPGHFDIKDSEGSPLKSGEKAPHHKDAVFGAFFDLEKVQRLCRKHGLRFAHRVAFVDRFTVRIMGE